MKRFTILFAALTGVWLAFGTASTVCADEPQEYFEKTFFAPETPVEGKLAMDAEWRIWIPSDVKTLRGVVVHQHGCGTGSGDGGRTAVYDWHWQALARKHDCALIAVSYRQGDLACELWCDPRNGSAQSFLDALDYFAEVSGRPELTRVPWALWGHSGGGQWVGSMCSLYPKRIAGAWLRSGCPDTVAKTFDELPMNDDVRNVPMMLNLGKYEFDFGIVWGSCWPYFGKMRAQGAKIGLIMDPKTHHETGSSRYPAIRFLDDCLTARLPDEAGSDALRPTPEGFVLPIEQITDKEICADDVVKNPEKPDGNYDAAERREFMKDGVWLPNKEYVDVWRKYSVDCTFDDTTNPPEPTDVTVDKNGTLKWKCRADIESGLRTFIIYCDGEEIAKTPTAPCVNSRETFQGVMYSDTPDFSLPEPTFTIENYDPERSYSVAAENTNGLRSEKVVAKFPFN